MKVLVVFIHNEDSERTSDALVKAGLRFTVIDSTGGFLQEPNMTYVVGLADERVEECLAIFREKSEPREVGAPTSSLAGIEVRPEEFGGTERGPITVTLGGAVGFLVDAERVLAQ